MFSDRTARRHRPRSPPLFRFWASASSLLLLLLSPGPRDRRRHNHRDFAEAAAATARRAGCRPIRRNADAAAVSFADPVPTAAVAFIIRDRDGRRRRRPAVIQDGRQRQPRHGQQRRRPGRLLQRPRKSSSTALQFATRGSTKRGRGKKYRDDDDDHDQGAVKDDVRGDDAAAAEADDDDDDDNSNDVDWVSAQFVGDDYYDDEEEAEWIPDSVKARLKREDRRVYAPRIDDDDDDENEQTKGRQKRRQGEVANNQDEDDENNGARGGKGAGPYTEEEEEIIASMGGRTTRPGRKRERGYLGDSTLEEICTDYGVPVCYIADVLCMWGVPVPIHVRDRLGDLVTGEQAFAILEAINTLDVSSLHDRYSNVNLLQLCYENDIPVQDAFQLAMKEGWSLPFGVQTCLRVEQEDELVRVLGNPLLYEEDDEDDDLDLNDLLK